MEKKKICELEDRKKQNLEIYGEKRLKRGK
jgi:hypothetical protein